MIIKLIRCGLDSNGGLPDSKCDYNSSFRPLIDTAGATQAAEAAGAAQAAEAAETAAI